jgi:hypothetical protein
MTQLDLRPLSIGEILDRTFTLYRKKFWLFLGISALPNLLPLAFGLSGVLLAAVGAAAGATPGAGAGAVASMLGLGLVAVVVRLLAVLLSQGATVTAVSELYLGRTIGIMESFRRVRGELGLLFGILFLSGLATGVGFLLLIIPGIIVMCRLIVSLPSGLLENLGARESLSRSWDLTRGNTLRAFLILLLFYALQFGLSFGLSLPLAFLAPVFRNHPLWATTVTVATQVITFLATVLTQPILNIASAVFYYDLRVRKEGFDIQMMMNPEGTRGPILGGVPSMFS